MIPFKYGSVVSGKDFCGRKDYIKELSKFVVSSQNVLIQGERRIGKTSLIYETVRKMKNYRPLLIDLMEIKTSHDFCQRIIKSIITLEFKSNFLVKVLKYLSSLRPQLGIDPLTGLPTVSLDPSVELTPESLEEVFDLIKEINNKKNVVVVFDEFQDVLNLSDAGKTLAVLRSKIQYHNNIPYIFAGSIRNKMDEIFIRPDSPLFKSAVPMTVGPLQKKEFSDFIRKKFSTGKRTITNNTLEQIFKITDNITGDIQQLCEALWSVTSYNDSISEDRLRDTFELIFAREAKSYELILSELTALQFKCLAGLAKSGGMPPTSSSFLKFTGISQPSSVTKALSKPLKLKIIFKVNNEYRFFNPFFKAWISYKNL
jgi:hypothetical protein